MKFFIPIIVLLVCTIATAQRIVTGRVTDIAGDAIFGVAIQIKGTKYRRDYRFLMVSNELMCAWSPHLFLSNQTINPVCNRDIIESTNN